MTQMNSNRAVGRVFLVGAGPGDPELLTLRALRILKNADIVLHDDLVSPETLALIRTQRVENVGKRCGRKRTSQEAIHRRMIDLARAGFVVARLKCGDPLIFGRAGEEMDALQEAGVEFEIVPGVTAASSAGAAARIALTDRRYASQMMFVSAHHSILREAVAGLGLGSKSETTLVVHMPGNDFSGLERELLESGRGPETPCVIVSSAGRAGEQIFPTTLANLAQAPLLPSPKILIVGEVASRAVRSNDAGIAGAGRFFASDKIEASLALASVSQFESN